MKAPHTLDPSRLDRLRGQSEDAISAAARAQDAHLHVHQKIGAARADIRLWEERSSANLVDMSRRQLSEKTAEINEQIAKLVAEKNRLYAVAEVAREKSSAIRELYRRCAEFAGVDPYAR
ncbi:hypothetical protein [Rhizobium leguminosarum]|uniref:hypothetical protein n=1 Tax=Rhizobium leguminosarum TaxID=384 RepID=UPI00102F673D|nr:hypothetical protein [Rhizobium leguminosarum]TAY68454.1 hypothetical protein ELH82_20845 [Rhizobium leguminosarum]